jgi:hypothetical protein
MAKAKVSIRTQVTNGTKETLIWLKDLVIGNPMVFLTIVSVYELARGESMWRWGAVLIFSIVVLAGKGAAVRNGIGEWLVKGIKVRAAAATGSYTWWVAIPLDIAVLVGGLYLNEGHSLEELTEAGTSIWMLAGASAMLGLLIWGASKLPDIGKKPVTVTKKKKAKNAAKV